MKAPNQGPVDWQARSQVLEGALRRMIRAGGNALYQWQNPHGEDGYHQHSFEVQLNEARAALGLPDEEGEGPIDTSCPCSYCRATDDGAAPPPRGPSAQGADEEGNDD